MVKVTSSNLILNNTLTPPLTQQKKMGITGSIGMWVGQPPPPGALFCNGGTYNRSDYPLLADSLGIAPGQLTFQVPNLNGRLPRGTNNVVMPRATGGQAKITKIGHDHNVNQSRFVNPQDPRIIEIGNSSPQIYITPFTGPQNEPVVSQANTGGINPGTQIDYYPQYLAVNFIIYT